MKKQKYKLAQSYMLFMIWNCGGPQSHKVATIELHQSLNVTLIFSHLFQLLSVNDWTIWFCESEISEGSAKHLIVVCCRYCDYNVNIIVKYIEKKVE